MTETYDTIHLGEDKGAQAGFPEVSARLKNGNELKIPSPPAFASFLKEKEVIDIGVEHIRPEDKVLIEKDSIKIGELEIPAQSLMSSLGRGDDVDEALLRWDYERAYTVQATGEKAVERIYQIPIYDKKTNSVTILRFRKEEYGALLDKLFGKERQSGKQENRIKSTALSGKPTLRETTPTREGEKEIELISGKLDAPDGALDRVIKIEHASSLGAREADEDYIGDYFFRISGDPRNDALYFAALADGMGGLKKGDEASRIAIESIENILYAKAQIGGKNVPRLKYENGQYQIYDFKTQQWEQLGEDLKGKAGDGLVKKIAEEANRQVYEWNRQNNKNRRDKDGGTTFVGALMVGNTLKIVNVGDSRAYIQDTDGKLRQATKDHSLMQSLIDAGRITPEEAVTHQDRSVIYRSIGDKPTVEADIYTMELNPGMRLVLTCDGIPGALGEEYLAPSETPRIMSALSSSGAGALVREAIKKDACDDNCSAVTISYEGNKARIFTTPEDAIGALGKEISRLTYSISQPDWEDRKTAFGGLLTQLSDMKDRITGEDKQKYAMMIREFANLVRDLETVKS